MNFEGMGEKKKKTPSTINRPANITSADPIGRGHHTNSNNKEREGFLASRRHCTRYQKTVSTSNTLTRALHVLATFDFFIIFYIY